jgi:hypothetical protein
MRVLAVLVLVALVASGAAFAAKGEPKKKINPADQARARAMLVKKSDLGPAFKGERSSGGNTSFNCAALDESDLTITGLADSPDFSAGVTFVSSEAQVYVSVGDAARAWHKDTSEAGISCLRDTLRREFAKQGLQLVGVRKLAFPAVAPKTAAYRIELTGQSQGVSVTVVLDAVLLLRSRAEVTLVVGSGLVPPARAVEVRLARTLASRMKTAMRGA